MLNNSSLFLVQLLKAQPDMTLTVAEIVRELLPPATRLHMPLKTTHTARDLKRLIPVITEANKRLQGLPTDHDLANHLIQSVKNDLKIISGYKLEKCPDLKTENDSALPGQTSERPKKSLGGRIAAATPR